jgi:hypothetical protein
MADTPGKRSREARKRRKQEEKLERKRLRKEGLLGKDNTGLFAPGEQPRETVDDPDAPPVPPGETPAPEQP